MTVGLPGAGVGGIFYLLSALLMPVHASLYGVLLQAGALREGGQEPPRWALVWRQFAMALGIIAGLWLTGWAIASFLVAHPTALGQIQTTAIGQRLPNVLRVAAVMVSVGTLFGVLAMVQVARLVVSPEPRIRRALAPTGVALLCLLSSPARAQTAPDSALTRHIAAADQAYDAGDTILARAEYEAALGVDPYASRPLYRLGELSRARPRAAQNYFRRYVSAEPQDPWGWIALGNAYASGGRNTEALAAYDSAARIAPRERDVVVGRARVLARAGHTDASIAIYEGWIASQQTDAEALRALADERRKAGRFREAARAYGAALAVESTSQTRYRLAAARGFSAPSVELQTDGARDSDDNQTTRVRAAVAANVADRVRAGVVASRRWLSGDPDFTVLDVTVDEATLGVMARPLAALRLDVSGGVAVARGLAAGGDEAGELIGTARGTWRQPGGRGSVDLRASRVLLDATPLLVENRVVRNEVAGRGDLPVAPRVSLRGGARAASYASPAGDNTRLSFLGGVAAAATNAIELSAVFQRVSFADSSAAGYFAPRTAQLAEAATYAEFESESGTVLAVDAGAGAQRFTEFGGAAGKWEPSFRLFASLSAPLRPGSEFRLELDSYDSRLGSDAAVTSNWRFASLSAAIRFAFH